MTVLEDILSQEIIQKLGWTLLHFIWQAAVVALLLAILLRVLRKSTANLRYIFACLALGLIVLLPVITIKLVPVSAPQSAANIEPAPAPAVLSIEEMPPAETTIVEEPEQLESVAPISADSWKQRTIELLEPALPYIVSGWLVGVFGLSIWHLGGWAQLQRLKRRMVKQVDYTLGSKLKVLTQRLRVNRTVQLMESALVQIPTVVGWLRPVILLPASALTGLTSEQLEAILAHELAHIKRVDYLVNILQTVVEILGFYHPAVWWVSHKIRAERENCCDDLAVSISGDRVCYARALTSMEEIRTGQGQLAVAATGGNLFRRIYRLVGKDSAGKTGFSWIPAVITILLIIALVIPTTLALTAHNRIEDPAKSLLDKMLEHRSKVKNVQFVAEYDIWHAGYSEEFIENIRKSMRERGIPEQQLQRMTRGFSRVAQSRYQILKCTIDNEERAKIERTTGTYDSSGKKLPSGDKNISAWNGVLGTDFNQRRGSTGAATFKDTPPTGASRQGQPWKTFTGNFCRQLAEAIKTEKQIRVDESKDGTYRVVFDKGPIIKIAVIDPSQGYSCILNENYNKEKLAYRSTAKYKEVAKGIWFPVSGQTESYASDGSLSSKSTIETSQIIINDPAFNESFFDVDLPKGAQVRDHVRGKHYVVGSKSVYELVEPGTLAEEDVPGEVDPNSWQKAFYTVYRLKDGEILKRIAPPFIPERRNFFLNQPGRHSSNANYHMAIQYTFNWDGELKEKSARIGSGIPRLNSILESVIGLGNFEYDIPSELLQIDMSGDWIVRKDTPTEALMKALKEIVKNETARKIDFVKQKVETEVIIAQGKYDLKPLSSVKEGNYILICTDKMDTYSGGGGGSGTVSRFLRWVGNRINMNIIDETESEDIKIYWRNHDSSNLGRLSHNKELYNERLDMLLSNLTRQTELTFERKTAAVEKWFIAEEGAIRAPQKTDVSVEDDRLTKSQQDKESSTGSIPDILPTIAKSPTLSAKDKAHVQVDCLIVEVSLDLKMDRETTIMAENLLGNKISLRDTKVDVLLRKAAEAKAVIEDESARKKRVTEQEFNALVEMLTSRGYIKILMNPTLEVINGKTAKISSSQHVPLQVITKTIPGAAGLTTIVSTETEYIDVVDSLEITPHVFADGHITLEVEAAINSKSIPKGVEQIPIITTREISTRVRTSSGESLIIGGLTEKDPAPGDNVKNSKKWTAEVLFILTPTIITPATDSQEKTDTQVKGEEIDFAKNSEVSKSTADKTRIVHFPKERAVGRLKVRDTSSDDDSDRGLLSLPGWVLLGQAQGDVSVPAGKDLRLEIYEEVTDFSFLADIEPKYLQVLEMSNTETTDDDLVHIKGLTGLLGLDLGSTSIKGAGLVHIAPLTSLRKLSLFNTQVSDAGLVHLSTLRSLKYLNLYITQVKGPGLKHLKSLTSLVRLDLAATPITDESLAHLAEMTWLKELELQDTDIGNKGLANLKPLRSLEELILGYADLKQGYSPITDEGLVYLKELGSLKHLYLLRTRVTDAGLAHLRNLKKLEALLLTETQITGEGLAFLKDLPELKYLDLKKTAVTDKGLVYLKDLKSLSKLYISSDSISEADLEDLEKALPNCTINGRKSIATVRPLKSEPILAENEQDFDMQDEVKSAESAEKLKELGKALFIYANDHDDKYPDSLHHLPVYSNVEELKWVLANVKYLEYGKTIAVRPDTVIAYDKMLLAERKGTNVLFNDSHVEFIKPERLKELGISATEILITTHILSVSEDFLKDIGIDVNSVYSSDAWSEHLVADSAADPNSETYSLILDELNVRLLLKAVQAHQGSKMLAAPQVMSQEGKTAEIGIIQNERYYVSSYTEPNRPSDEPEPKKDKVEIGTRIWLKPELTPDKENVRLDFKLEIRQLLGYEERRYKGKYKYIVPRTEVVSTQTQLVVPDGKTLLIGGLKIIEQVESRSGAPLLSKLPLIGRLFRRSDKIKEQRLLLILVKPTINPQQKASKILRGEADSEEHIKSLGRLLEKKLNRSAEPK